MAGITVKIDSSRPIFIEADADAFGKVFADMSDVDQIATLRAIVEHMAPHRMQWDYIAIALEAPENATLRNHLREVLFPPTEEPK